MDVRGVPPPPCPPMTSNHPNILAHPVAEPETELVEELDVLQDVVVGGARVGVLVVVAVDEELHDRLLRVGGDQGLERERIQGLSNMCQNDVGKINVRESRKICRNT